MLDFFGRSAFTPAVQCSISDPSAITSV